ncbi:DUF6265 family protein [Autumnicola edwardsiae]|uniref:DUF6265 family protein n=1 Tax=Autumnicola edwardsiae TaxID=3075594 RepID=A0ABU3CRM0_9FLAO|nr:DUF6265 family protein [Zunongwangia sp. F297]MDT0648998.1 DUF6265 family protein [Zunongwangia sp. F297]
MKALFTFCLALIIFSFGNIDSSKAHEDQQVSFDWMLGTWKRTNNTDNSSTFENWIKKSSEEYSGVGYTLNNRDTIFKEDLRFFYKAGNWNLEVTGEDEKPVIFPVSTYASNKFIAENEENEFPKKITYQLQNDQLLATITDGETEIPFIFSKTTRK